MVVWQELSKLPGPRGILTLFKSHHHSLHTRGTMQMSIQSDILSMDIYIQALTLLH